MGPRPTGGGRGTGYVNAALGGSADAVAEAGWPKLEAQRLAPMPAGENISALTGEWPMSPKAEAECRDEKIAAKGRRRAER